MEIYEIISLLLGIFGILVSVYYERKNSKLTQSNKKKDLQLQNYSNLCSNQCNPKIYINK